MKTNRKKGTSTMTLKEAIRIARINQPDAEYAAKVLEEAGCSYSVAKQALYAVFGYNVLGN